MTSDGVPAMLAPPESRPLDSIGRRCVCRPASSSSCRRWVDGGRQCRGRRGRAHTSPPSKRIARARGAIAGKSSSSSVSAAGTRPRLHPGGALESRPNCAQLRPIALRLRPITSRLRPECTLIKADARLTIGDGQVRISTRRASWPRSTNAWRPMRSSRRSRSSTRWRACRPRLERLPHGRCRMLLHTDVTS